MRDARTNGLLTTLQTRPITRRNRVFLLVQQWGSGVEDSAPRPSPRSLAQVNYHVMDGIWTEIGRLSVQRSSSPIALNFKGQLPNLCVCQCRKPGGVNHPEHDIAPKRIPTSDVDNKLGRIRYGTSKRGAQPIDYLVRVLVIPAELTKWDGLSLNVGNKELEEHGQ